MWEGSQKVQWPFSAVLSGRMLSPSSRPDARCFSSSPYASGVLQSTGLCCIPEGVSLSKSVCGARPFMRRGLRILQFLLPTQPLVGFYSQKLWGHIFLALEPWAGWSYMGLGSHASRISLCFISTMCRFGTNWSQVSMSPPLCPSYPSG